jgi:hypothetical protein
VNKSGKTLGPAAAGNDTQSDFGQSQNGIVGCYSEVAAQRDFGTG